MQQNRVLYLDFLKVVASLAVVFIHAAASKWYILPINSFDWKFLNLINVLTRFSVPIFIMVSGVLLLNPNKEYSFELLFKKYIPKVLIAYVLGSSLFAIVSFYTDPQTYTLPQMMMQFIYRTIKGPSHLWYLFTIAGFYVITPFIKKLVKNDKGMTEKLIILGFILNSILYLNLIYNLDTVYLYIGYFNITFGTGYMMYFVLGHYLVTYPLSQKLVKSMLVLGPLAILITYFATDYYSVLNQKAFENFYGYLQPNIFFISVFVFTLAMHFEKYLSKTSSFFKQTIQTLAKYNLVIYIVHPMFITFLADYQNLDIPLSLWIVILGIISYLLSVGVAWIFHQLLKLKDCFKKTSLS